jgi:hypothetical protein
MKNTDPPNSAALLRTRRERPRRRAAVNMRDMPNTMANIAAVLVQVQDDPVEILADNDDGTWLLVSAVVAGTTRIGWIRTDLLATPGPPSAPGDVKVLANVRKRFADELLDPDMHRLLAASTAAEVGGQGPKADQYYIESVFNRAAARNRSLKKTVTDSDYYPSTTLNKLGKTFSAAEQARIDKIIDSVMGGSNESDFATGKVVLFILAARRSHKTWVPAKSASSVKYLTGNGLKRW